MTVPPAQVADFLRPGSVAIVGASRDPDALGGRLLPILRAHGYPGRIFLVNPSGATIGGEPSYQSVDDLPEPAELAVVVVAAARVAETLEACGRRGIGKAIVLSSGFAEEAGPDGRERQEALQSVARRHGILVLGPNCEGFANLAARTPLTFSPAIDFERALRRPPVPGSVAVVSQSGGLGFALFNDAMERHLAFSHVVTTGNEAGLDALDVLGALVEEPATTVVLCFLEGVSDPDRLRRIAGRARETGTVVVAAKVGRSAAAARASRAHTAHEVGDAAAFDRLVADAALVPAADQEELVDLGMAFSRAPSFSGGGVGVLTISGGAGAWAADALASAGFEVPELDPALQDALRAYMPAYGAPANPVDLTARALAVAGLAPPLELLLASPDIGAVVLASSFGSPRSLEQEGAELRRVVAEAGKPVVVYSYTRPSEESARLLAEAGLAWYPTPVRAARALAALATHGQSRSGSRSAGADGPA